MALFRQLDANLMPTRLFPGRLDSLKEISDYVGPQAVAAGLDEGDVYAVQLAVEEAAANIVQHAYGEKRSGDIEISCSVREGEIELRIKDTGRPFAPEEIPEPAIGAPLEEWGPGGAGLFLINKLMDEVEFDFRDRANILTMIKRKTGAS